MPKGKPHKYGASQRNPWTIQWVHFVGDDAPYFLTLLKGEHALPIHPELTRKLDRLFGDAYELLARGFSEQSIICVAQIVRHISWTVVFQQQGVFARDQNRPVQKSRPRDSIYGGDHIERTLTINDMATSRPGYRPPTFRGCSASSPAFRRWSISSI